MLLAPSTLSNGSWANSTTVPLQMRLYSAHSASSGNGLSQRQLVVPYGKSARTRSTDPGARAGSKSMQLPNCRAQPLSLTSAPSFNSQIRI